MSHDIVCSIVLLLNKRAMQLTEQIEEFETNSRRAHEQQQMLRDKQSNYDDDYGDDCYDFEEYLSDRLENEYTTLTNIVELTRILNNIRVIYQADYDEISRLFSEIFDLNNDENEAEAEAGTEEATVKEEVIDYLKKLKLLIQNK